MFLHVTIWKMIKEFKYLRRKTKHFFKLLKKKNLHTWPQITLVAEGKRTMLSQKEEN